uniref:Uncharacterized protein n=1 Tax=Syphacia muris TaxID=451379 RepID=A0A0N5A9C4_9BILA
MFVERHFLGTLRSFLGGSGFLRIIRNHSNVQKSEVPGDLLLGKIIQLSYIGLDKIACAKVRCRLNEFDNHLKMYFTYSQDYWAVAPNVHGGLGDDVIIRCVKKEARTSAAVTHEVEKIVFKYGNIIDPITKKRVIQEKFTDELELEKMLVGSIIEEPLKQESLLFEEQRSLQRKQLQQREEQVKSASEEQCN